MQIENIYLKYLVRSHTIIGLVALFLFFLATYFGMITLFSPYINAWQNPSRHYEIQTQKELNLDFTMFQAMKALNYPNDNVEVVLPSFREKTISVGQGFSNKVYINPYTNKVLDTQNEDDLITLFFNDIHVGRNIPVIGQLLMGVASIGFVFLLISGCYLYLLNRKRKNRENFWFKWHKNLSLVFVPYILVFALTGSVLGFMLSSSTPFALAVTEANESNMRKLVAPILFPKHKNLSQSEQNVDMLEYSKLYDLATKSYPELTIKSFHIYRWYEHNAHVVFRGYLENARTQSSSVNRLSITLSGVDGRVLAKKTMEDSHLGNRVLSLFYFFHFLVDEEIEVRVIIALLSIVFALSILFGFLIWLEKQKMKHKSQHEYYSLMTKLTLSVMFGVIPASAFLLALYWILPFELMDRETWIMGAFYAFWTLTLLLYVACRSSFKVSIVLCFFTALFLLVAVGFHDIKMNYYFFNGFQNRLRDIFYVDIVLCLLAVVFVCIGYAGLKMSRLRSFYE